MPLMDLRRPLAATLLGAALLSPPPARAAAVDTLGAAAPVAVETGPKAPAPPAPPLFVDPSDMGFGLSLVYRRVPNSADVAALAYYDNVQHLVVALPRWPEDYAALEPLGRVILPQGADLIVLLQGYPPSSGQASLWNMIRQPMRIILTVDGPPVDRGMIMELNAMRGLERVIATMDHPSRSGFERLQRPLSFRVLVP